MTEEKTIEKLEELCAYMSRIHVHANYIINPSRFPLGILISGSTQMREIRKFIDSSTRKERKQFFKETRQEDLKQCYKAIGSDIVEVCKLLNNKQDFANIDFSIIMTLKEKIFETDKHLAENEALDTKQAAKIIEKSFFEIMSVTRELDALVGTLMRSLRCAKMTKEKEMEHDYVEIINTLLERLVYQSRERGLYGGSERLMRVKPTKDLMDFASTRFFTESVSNAIEVWLSLPAEVQSRLCENPLDRAVPNDDSTIAIWNDLTEQLSKLS